MTTHPTSTRAVAARRIGSYVCGTLLLLPALCLATDVRVVAVTPGRSAEVVIEHGAPVTLEVGETVDGVKLLGANRSSAVLSVDGITRTLKLGEDPAAVGEAVAAGTITLSADGRGQFFTTGTVNGRAVHFVVDTGATITALSRADAGRIGLDYRGGRPVQAMTVNGVVHGWSVSLGSVRVGDVTEHDVDAVVIDNDSLPLALLGMSFLGRFDMHRQGARLVLYRRH